MKNKSYIGFAFVILVFGIWAVPKIVARYKNNDVVVNDRLNMSNSDKTIASLEKVGPVASFSCLNQNQQKVTNVSLLGKVYVVEFFFTKCPSICPVMNLNMRAIDSAFANRKDFQIASITIDPENDTPEVLLQHAKKLNASENWQFLRADKSYTFNIANKGFNLYAGQNASVAGGFEHSGLFALVDKSGNIRSRKDKLGNTIVYYDGLSKSGVSDLIEDIKILLN